MTSKFSKTHLEIRLFMPVDEAEITMKELVKSTQIKTLFQGLAMLKESVKSKKKEPKRAKHSQ